MLKMRLELTGEFEVLVAEDGEQGCEIAAAKRPDLILMDLEMPVVDGWEATRRLKSKPETRDMPVIGLSAHALADEREKALAAGCGAFDTKPVEFDRLLGKLRKRVSGLGVTGSTGGHGTRGSRTPVILTPRPWRLNAVWPRIRSNGCWRWQPNWSAARSPRSLGLSRVRWWPGL